ncbi:mitochondrial ribosomal protein S15 (uS15m) [Andalucia godoyi]|uniref:30S ribosomal protein S15 n=1 Tax=Andalucia godoyi TaxID=505711 RepID=A0A8K0AIL5_ANDGO|nr:mitochondrial ribosomal protein S15 (uS15m) [Andalucia godoyi]|eukprot:ANDGO_03225.mRNA.1 mitochondrial ribosomal protein S15 (uS15m)
MSFVTAFRRLLSTSVAPAGSSSSSLVQLALAPSMLPRRERTHIAVRAAIAANARSSEFDTGCPEAQVAGLTLRISSITTHLGEHKKDVAAAHGLQQLVQKRRGLLTYLRRIDEARYRAICEKLGLRG